MVAPAFLSYYWRLKL